MSTIDRILAMIGNLADASRELTAVVVSLQARVDAIERRHAAEDSVRREERARARFWRNVGPDQLLDDDDIARNQATF